jgi:hypothetical protein
MREIKLKFFYTDGKEWITKVFTLDEIMNGEPFDYISDSPFFRYYKMVDRVQYIEQHDISGEAIYEGDIIYIVKDRFGVGRHEVWVVQYMDGIPMACNQVNSFRAITPSFSEYYVNSENVTSPVACFSIDGEEEVSCKIHGNIHENPELLS